MGELLSTQPDREGAALLAAGGLAVAVSFALVPLLSRSGDNAADAAPLDD